MSTAYAFIATFLYITTIITMVVHNRYADHVQAKYDKANKGVPRWDQTYLGWGFRYTKFWALGLTVAALIPILGVLALGLTTLTNLVILCSLLRWKMFVTDRDSHPSIIKFLRKPL